MLYPLLLLQKIEAIHEAVEIPEGSCYNTIRFTWIEKRAVERR